MIKLIYSNETQKPNGSQGNGNQLISEDQKKQECQNSKSGQCFLLSSVITEIVAEYVPPGQTINQKYCIELLLKLQERIQRKSMELWETGWILHQHKCPIALLIWQFLAKEQVLVHPLLHILLHAVFTLS